MLESLVGQVFTFFDKNWRLDAKQIAMHYYEPLKKQLNHEEHEEKQALGLK